MRTFTITAGTANACFCTGPRNGEPCCPCEMRARGIFKRDGRWVEPARGERDLGPAYSPEMYDTSSFDTMPGCGCKVGSICANVACPHRVTVTC